MLVRAFAAADWSVLGVLARTGQVPSGLHTVVVDERFVTHARAGEDDFDDEDLAYAAIQVAADLSWDRARTSGAGLRRVVIALDVQPGEVSAPAAEAWHGELLIDVGRNRVASLHLDEVAMSAQTTPGDEPDLGWFGLQELDALLNA